VRERGGKRVGSARERDGSGQGRERDFRPGSAVREVRSAAGSAVPGRSRSERESEVRTGGGGRFGNQGNQVGGEVFRGFFSLVGFVLAPSDFSQHSS
jgi:hypothetical protein